MRAARGFTHWVIYGMPPDATGIAERGGGKFTQGPNGAGKSEYFGRCRRRDTACIIIILAVRARQGAGPQSRPGSRWLIDAIEDHVIEQARSSACTNAESAAGPTVRISSVASPDEHHGRASGHERDFHRIILASVARHGTPAMMPTAAPKTTSLRKCRFSCKREGGHVRREHIRRNGTAPSQMRSNAVANAKRLRRMSDGNELRPL